MNAQKDIVGETLGDWGRWQRRSILLIFLCKIPACFCMAIIIFTAPVPQQLPVLCTTSTPIASLSSARMPTMTENQTIAYRNESYHRPHHEHHRSQQMYVMHPAMVEPNDQQFHIDYCDVPMDLRAHARQHNIDKVNRSQAHDLTTLSDLADVEGNLSIPCDALAHRPFYYSKETTFDLVCSRNLVAAFAQFFHLFGVVSGGLIALALVTLISPKNLMLCGMFGQIVCGCSLAYIDIFWLQCLIRLLCSISCAQMYTAGAIIFADITGGRHRTYVTCLFDTFWSIGVIIMPAISYYAESWQNTYLAISLPTCAYVMVWYWMADSPRWHLQNGNYAKAADILMGASTINDKSRVIRTDLYAELREPKKIRDARGHSDDGWLWCQLWTDRKTLLNIICIHVAWGVFITNLNGLLLNTRAFGNDSVRWNVTMTGCSEIIGVLFGLLFVLDAKRKWISVGLLNIFGGVIVLFLLAFFKEFADNTNTVLVITVALLIKIFTSITHVLLLSSTAELVPVKYRKSLLLSCTVCGRTCLLTASFIGSLTLVSAVRPFIVFSLMGTIGGFALCILDPSLKLRQRNKSIEMDELDKLTGQRNVQ